MFQNVFTKTEKENTVGFISDLEKLPLAISAKSHIFPFEKFSRTLQGNL